MDQDDRSFAPEADPPEVVLRKKLHAEAARLREIGLAPYIVDEKLNNLCLLTSHRLARQSESNMLFIALATVVMITGVIAAIVAPPLYCIIGGLVSAVCSFPLTYLMSSQIGIAKQRIEIECFRDREGLSS